MTLPILKNRRDISKIRRTDTKIRCYYYLTLPLAKDLCRVVPNLKKVIVTPSRRVAAAAKTYLKEKKVKVIVAGKAGAPPQYTRQLVERIRFLVKQKTPYSIISEKYGIPKSSINYLVTKRKN